MVPSMYDNSPKFCVNSLSAGSIFFADVLIGAVNILLEVPNPKSPANPEAGRLFTNNRNEFNRVAKAYTLQHAGSH